MTLRSPVPNTNRNSVSVLTDGEAIDFVCPSCSAPLLNTQGEWYCESEDLRFQVEDGIHDFILPSRRDEVNVFLSLYQELRSRECWGSPDVRYYLALPYRDLSKKHRDIWRLRAKSFDLLLKCIGEKAKGGILQVLDVGAGSCWLSARLSQMGHRVTAVDINTDSLDGLGVAQRLTSQGRAKFTCVRAEFDYLPFPSESFDIVVFNASIHYSRDVTRTAAGGFRLLRHDGTMVILDSPLYPDVESGEAMIKEREEVYKKKFGMSLPRKFGGRYLTNDDLTRLASFAYLERLSPKFGLRTRLHSLVSCFLLRRHPATFEIIILRKE
jgi:SAM-dependent methyltransferase